MNENALKIAVVGAGMGGLTAAIALTRIAGADVTIFEQAKELKEVGAGVQLTPNGERALNYLGLFDDVKKVTAEYDQPGIYRREDGTRIGEQVWTDSSGKYAPLGLHRADFIDLLTSVIPQERILLQHRVKAVRDMTSSVELEFENGSREEFDLVIGADGIHSTVRESMVGSSDPVYSGSVVYRGVVESARLPKTWLMTHQIWMGEGKHFMTYPVRQRKLINFVGFMPRDESVEESWSAEGNLDDLTTAFDGWDPELCQFIKLIERTNWWGLYDRLPLLDWTWGRVALLGDSAHAMLPHAGQGVNMAIEDSVSLAVLLEGVSSDRAAKALKSYEALRLDRTASIQVASRRSGALYDSKKFDDRYDYTKAEERDADLLEAKDFRRGVLYDFDAYLAAQNAP
ncbi:FAD-dependent monooxygenase [Parafrigoribacterium humi]|uniref:FAD-dependent monooxygenase n=1 Tax=Parafrigoribacterium humi TaxID=3144664 RepID=UPI0032EB9E9E